jgi:hypothetical protein
MSATGISERAPSRVRREGRPVLSGPLSRQMQEARRRGDLPETLTDRYQAMRCVFEQISGVVPAGEKTPDDIQRLRILDAVILELSALEREVFLPCSTAAPEEMQSARAELLERVNHPARGPEAPPPESSLMDSLRMGRPVRLLLEVDRLSPAGLVAMGQLVHFEPEVRVRRVDGDPGAGAWSPPARRRVVMVRRRRPGAPPAGAAAAADAAPTGAGT